MRQAQQNRRGRGRNNNNNHNSNRKGQNPLTRSFESNGPDVKIRGTPSHIAEKYVAMARDALSSGDPVLAENYLQHAEHYNRIIMTHRETQGPQHGEHGQGHQGGNGQHALGRHRNPGDPIDDEPFGDDDDGGDFPVRRGSEPQPSIRGNDRDERGPKRNNQQRRDRAFDRGQERGPDRPERSPERSTERSPERSQERDRSGPPDRERGHDRERAAGDRGRTDKPQELATDRGGQAERAPVRERTSEGEPASGGRPAGRGARRERYAQSDDQPEFLKRPVRRPRAAAVDDDGDGDAAPRRPAKSDEAAE